MTDTKQYHHGDLANALLRALESIITEQGIERVTLREAARRAGVSHSAPAHHFGDLEGMLQAFALEGYEILHGLMLEAIARVDAGPDRHALDYLNEIGTVYLRFAFAHPAHYEAMFRRSYDPGNNPESPLLIASANTFGPLAVIIGQLVERGVIGQDQGRYAATILWGMVHGVASLWNDGHLPRFYEDHTPDEVIAGVLETMYGMFSEG